MFGWFQTQRPGKALAIRAQIAPLVALLLAQSGCSSQMREPPSSDNVPGIQGQGTGQADPSDSSSGPSMPSQDDEHLPGPDPAPGPTRGVVIKHGWDIPMVDLLPDMEQEIKDSPFDGIVFSGAEASRIFSHKPYSQELLAESLAPLAKLDPQTPSHLYMILYVDSVKGGFSGPGVQHLIANAERVGKELAKYPVKGIAFDNEVYRGNPWNMPQACPGLNREACGRAAFSAGKKMMQAFMKHWPKIRFMPFFGPWLHDERTYEWVNAYAPQNDFSEDDDIACDFLAGVFAATIDQPAMFIDGGEFYGLRTREHFEKTAHWTRDKMVQESPFFPDEIRSAYAKQSKVGFGIYDDRIHLFSKLDRLTPQRWAKVVRAASQVADLVWIYTERHDWWEHDGNNWPDTSIEGTEGPVPADWREAARQAIVGSPRPIAPL